MSDLLERTRPEVPSCRPRCGTLSALILAATALGACTADQNLVTASDGSQPPSLSMASGADLFRGLLFADGPVAGTIPELDRVGRLSDRVPDPAILQSIRSFQDRVIARIDSDDPRFFTHFEGEIRSGSPVRVEAALSSAAMRAYSAVVDAPEIARLREEFRKDPQLKERLLEHALLHRQHAAEQANVPYPDYGEDPFDVIIAATLDESGGAVDPAGLFLGPTFLIKVVWVFVYAQLAIVQDAAVLLNVYGGMNVQLAAFYDTYLWNTSGIEVHCPDPNQPSCALQPYYAGSTISREQLIYSIASILEP